LHAAAMPFTNGADRLFTGDADAFGGVDM
jgi:hypothetical protein